MKWVIGVDIGGTKISIVLGSVKGKVIERHTIETKHNEYANIAVRDIVKTIETILGKRNINIDKIIGFGVGIPGPIGRKIGVIQKAPNLPGWSGINIKNILEKKFKRPVFCNNDANAACIAERIFGAGKDVRSFIYITISTGIGSGIIINDKILMGANNNAAEFGHIIVDLNGPLCNCGKKGCLEALSSGTAIANMARNIVSNGRQINCYKKEYAYKVYTTFVDKRFRLSKKASFVGFNNKNKKSIRSEDVAYAAKKGDRIARYILWRSGYYLGVGIASLMHIINPEKIALGGSVMKAGNLYFNAMYSALKDHTWNHVLKACTITKAQLGSNVADVGAISLVLFK